MKKLIQRIIRIEDDDSETLVSEIDITPPVEAAPEPPVDTAPGTVPLCGLKVYGVDASAGTACFCSVDEATRGDDTIMVRLREVSGGNENDYSDRSLNSGTEEDGSVKFTGLHRDADYEAWTLRGDEAGPHCGFHVE